MPVTPDGKDKAIAIYQIKDNGKRKLTVVFNIDYTDKLITISLREESFGYLESENREFAVAQVYVTLQLISAVLKDLIGSKFNCDDSLLYGNKLVTTLSNVDTRSIFIDKHFDTFYLYDEVWSEMYGNHLWARRMRDGGFDRFKRESLFSFQPKVIHQMISHGTMNR